MIFLAQVVMTQILVVKD